MIAREVVLFCLMFGLASCGGAAPAVPRVDAGQVAGLGLDDLRARIQPYDLQNGGTAEGLAWLDAWLTLEPANAAAGFRLRADAHLDLWSWTRIAAGIDDASAARAVAVLAPRMGLPPGIPAEAMDRAELEARLVDGLAEDYRRAGLDAAQVEALIGLATWDPAANGAADAFGQWRAIDLGSRQRLLLAALLYRVAQRAGGDPGVMLADLAWLCGAERGDTVEELAAACGYWCAELPEAAPIGPSIEREAHQIEEDDTPIDWEPPPLEVGSIGQSFWPGSDGGWIETPEDVGYRLVHACGAEYFGLPRGGGVVLLDEANYLDLVFMTFVGDLLGGLERDLLAGDPLAVLASQPLATFADAFLRGNFPQHLTRAALVYDARLELPRLTVQDDSRPVAPTRLDTRLVVVSSDGLALSVTPHLQLARRDGIYELVWAEGDYHYPGRHVLRFPRLNRLDPDTVENERLPSLAGAVRELEAAVEAFGFAGDAASGRETPCGVRQGTPLSILVDGATYFATLRPILGTLRDCGYEPIRFFAWNEQEANLVEVPLAVAPREGPPRHRIAVERDRLLVRASSAAPESPLLAIDRTEQAPLSSLYGALAGGTTAAALADGTPLGLAIDDERIDFGRIVQIVGSVAFRRAQTAFADDADLLAAPIEAFDDPALSLLRGQPLWLEID